MKKKIDINSFFCYKRKHTEFIRKNKLILKTQQRPKSEKHSVFTEEINKIAISSNDDKRMQSIDSIEIYAYETRSSTGQKIRFSIKDFFSECDQIHSLVTLTEKILNGKIHILRNVVNEKEEMRCNNLNKRYKMINFDDVTNEDTERHNQNWPQIPDHPYRILITAGSGSGKTNSLFYLIIHQLNIDKIYSYTKDPYEAKYQFLINKRQSADVKHLNDSKAFIEYSNDISDIYKNIEE